MTFESPWALLALALVPLLLYGHLVLRRRRTRFAIRFTNVDAVAAVTEPVGRWRGLLVATLMLLAITSLVASLARPAASVLLPREDATVLLVLDTSGSMKNDDVEPSRMAAARSAATDFVAQLPPKFQVGVVAFDDKVDVLAQPTIDRVAVTESIASTRADGATAIGDALARAVELAPDNYRDAGGRRGTQPRDGSALTAILLLSDGSNTAGRMLPLEAAERAQRAELPVYTIALGPSEEDTEDPGVNDLLTSDAPDYDTLRGVAEATDGRYFSAPTESDLRAIYDSLASRLGFVRERQEITFAFAGSGAVLAAAAIGLSLVWRDRSL